MLVLRDDDGSLRFISFLGDAKTGRWCKPPQLPDRCHNCLEPDSLMIAKAEGYVEREGWRIGVCRRCPEEWKDGAVWFEDL